MSNKRRFAFATTLPPGGRAGENLYPSVLGGQRLQQLELPKEILAAVTQNRLSAAATVIAPSNLAEVRAKLKARKPKLG
jgi:hypothetical protein